MKKRDEDVYMTEEGFELKLRKRESKGVSLQIPIDSLESLEKIANSRDMSVEALIKFYVGQGLRQDIASLYANRLLEKTAQVLTRHIQSEEEISAILKEIQLESIS